MIHSITFTETQGKPIGTIRTIKVQNVAKSTRRMLQTKAVTYYFLIRNADVLVIQKQGFQRFFKGLFTWRKGTPDR